jgi:hypothetical protein
MRQRQTRQGGGDTRQLQNKDDTETTTQPGKTTTQQHETITNKHQSTKNREERKRKTWGQT